MGSKCPFRFYPQCCILCKRRGVPRKKYMKKHTGNSALNDYFNLSSFLKWFGLPPPSLPLSHSFIFSHTIFIIIIIIISSSRLPFIIVVLALRIGRALLFLIYYFRLISLACGKWNLFVHGRKVLHISSFSCSPLFNIFLTIFVLFFCCCFVYFYTFSKGCDCDKNGLRCFRLAAR